MSAGRERLLKTLLATAAGVTGVAAPVSSQQESLPPFPPPIVESGELRTTGQKVSAHTGAYQVDITFPQDSLPADGSALNPGISGEKHVFAAENPFQSSEFREDITFPPAIETASEIPSLRTQNISAEVTSGNSDAENEAQEEREQQNGKYQVAIDVMGEFLQTNSDPFIQETYARIVVNPSKHIEILDSLGYRDYEYYEGGVIYYIFPETRNLFDPESAIWSFAIQVADQDDPSITTASVSIQLNSDGNIYTGSNDSLPYYGSISLRDLIKASDTFFNIPGEMKSQIMSPIARRVPTLARSYKGYSQTANVNGIVTLRAPHPLPPEGQDISSNASNLATVSSPNRFPPEDLLA
ncbi:MAG: hypothetical protein HYW63_03245 [Candidatus Levybacteria bacterium]|nr:hypothetical protein [Candidatus Levybacteria bacterium]